MLLNVLRKLISPIKPNKLPSDAKAIADTNKLNIESLPPPSKIKPLSIQTIYRSSVASVETIELPESHLFKQRDILLNDPSFEDTEIEIYWLDESALLVGFTKHPHTILQGVFMYPHDILDTNRRTEMETQADQRNIPIAIFKLKQDINCLKITQNDNFQSSLYLIDHRAISAVKLVRTPAENS